MKKGILVVLLLTNISYAKNVDEIVVLRTVDMIEKMKISVSAAANEGGKRLKLWSSNDGIYCSLRVYSTDSVNGSFECDTKEGYKAQISFDCQSNTRIENAAYLFFGLVGRSDETGNFYVWCK